MGKKRRAFSLEFKSEAVRRLGGLTLVTRDADFHRVRRLIPGLLVVAPYPAFAGPRWSDDGRAHCQPAASVGFSAKPLAVLECPATNSLGLRSPVFIDAATLHDLDVLSTSTSGGLMLLGAVDRTRSRAGAQELRKRLAAPAARTT